MNQEIDDAAKLAAGLTVVWAVAFVLALVVTVVSWAW